MTSPTTYIYGKHVVGEALAYRSDTIEALYIARDVSDEAVLRKAGERGIGVRPFDMREPPANVPAGATHQGYVAVVDTARLLVPFADFVAACTVGPHTALVLLDELQDPQNVGAIIRSAAGFGISGILIPQHRQAQITGAVIKVSAGTAFRIPLVAIGNVNTALRDLKEKGFWVYGLEGAGDTPVFKESFDTPAVFVLGNEQVGIREKTLATCDFNLAIPLNPRCESLNVSAAAAVVLAAWSAQHPEALNE